jgi:hypothetical protein
MILLTVKLPRNPAHDPANKVIGACPVNGKFCTDVTGQHHTLLFLSYDALTAFLADHPDLHVTRKESA